MAVKIGILADTHGLLRPEVLDILKECSYILHAGDVHRPELLDQIRYMGNLYAVRGNNDGEWASALCETLSFTIENVKFFMVHDKRNAGRNLRDEQVVVYGHSHIYSEKTVDGRLWLNPGSCGYSRFGREVTMAVMTVEKGRCKVEKRVLAQ